MKVEIFGSDKAVRLRLVSEDGKVYLAEVDEEGAIVTSGRILWIDSDGVHRAMCYAGSLPTQDSMVKFS